MAPKAEKRADVDDGKKYSKEQFVEYYGQKQGTKRWEAAGKTAGTSKAKANAKEEKLADYSGLEKGMRLQAESEGKWFKAEVVALSNKKGSNAPVKVNWVGYTSASDEWVGADRLRTKAIKMKAPPAAKVADYSGLEKGMRVQGEADGKWYAAQVVTVSHKKGSNAPVKVNWVGYTSASDEWLGADRLRSKAITMKTPGKDGPKPKKLGGEDLLEVTKKSTAPIEGQKPGTSGLRKKTKVFMEGNYLNNFVQSVFNALIETDVPLKGGTLVVSGDGRYWNKDAIQIIIKMALANGVDRVWLGTDGLLSTPATSAVIRCRGKGGEPFGGFICSASHNPGGIDNDFGIKYNCENGGPAPEKATDKMVEQTGKITEYLICEQVPTIDLEKPGVYKIGNRTIEVFDCVEDHLALLKKCFSFNQIRGLLKNKDFDFCYDSMCGVQGPYARKILEKTLGGKKGSCTNADPQEDFGGPSSAWHGHADPNLTYAVELVKTMGLNKEGRKIETEKPPPVFGAAADGDADRNMIMGSQFFVSPSDSLAIIVANADLIPQFKKGLRGCARSMPTSGALDIVAKKKGIPCFEVPTGWKFFGNLMDSGTKYYPDKETYTPFVCGEESFGTGADHVREKDGMWAVLAWLQILAAKSQKAKKIVTPQEVSTEFWQEYGRNYYARYDYEGVDKPKAEAMMEKMKAKQGQLVGKTFGGMTMKVNDMFEYTDPVDGSVSHDQGIRFIFEDNSRIIFRLSGTGVAGATVRLYLEKYVAPDGDLGMHAFDVVKPLAALAEELSGLKAATGRDVPTVIT